MASKKVNQVNLKGELDLAEMTITEVVKEESFEYNFSEIIREFDGKTVSITIKEENELPTKDMD